MDSRDVEWATTELRMLRFPGTQVLQLGLIPGALDQPLCPEGWVPPNSAHEKETDASKERHTREAGCSDPHLKKSSEWTATAP